jgi:tetratricopeptide (TPR) repeat protein
MYAHYAHLASTNGRYDLAEQVLTAGLDRSPHQSQLLAERAYLDKIRGDLDGARRWLDEAVRFDRRNPTNYLNSIRFEVEVGDFARAAGVAEAALGVLQSRASLYSAAGQVSETWAEHLLVDVETRAAGWQRLSQARDQYDQARRLAPKNATYAEAVRRIGRRLLDRDADDPHLQAIAAADRDPTPLHEYARWLRGLGRWREAEARFRQALALQRSPQLLIELAQLLQSIGRIAEADEMYVEALRTSRDARQHGNYADFLASRMHDLERAERTYLAAHEMDRSSLEIMIKLAIFCYRHVDQPEHARQWFNRVLSRRRQLNGSQRSVAYQNYIEFLVDQGDFNEAQRVIAGLSPELAGRPAVIVACIGYHLRSGSAIDDATICAEFERAIENTKAGEASSRRQIRSNRQLAWICYRYAEYLWRHCSDYQRAERQFQQMLEAQPYPISTFVATYARFQIERGDFDGAQASIALAAETDAEDEAVVAARQELAAAYEMSADAAG